MQLQNYAAGQWVVGSGKQAERVGTGLGKAFARDIMRAALAEAVILRSC